MGAVVQRVLGGQGHADDFRVYALVPAWEIREDVMWRTPERLGGTVCLSAFPEVGWQRGNWPVVLGYRERPCWGLGLQGGEARRSGWSLR